MADDLSFNVKIEDNSPEIQKALKENMDKCLYIMGTRAVEGAVQSISFENLAVDTGRLRASISFVTAQGQTGQSGEHSDASKSGDTLSGKAPADSVQVGTNVEYAIYVHNGTSRMAERPFLKDGIENQRDAIQEGVKGVLEGRY